jgi:hypothetical protein
MNPRIKYNISNTWIERSANYEAPSLYIALDSPCYFLSLGPNARLNILFSRIALFRYDEISSFTPMYNNRQNYSFDYFKFVDRRR